MADTKIKAGQFHGVVGHGTDGYFLMTNADGSMSWAEGGSAGPSVTSVSYPGDDLAADPAGLQTVVLTGTGFAASGMTVSIGGTTVPSVAHDSNTQLTITTPEKAAGDYDIVVTNTVTGASGTFVNGISYNGVPTWTTAAGSLGTFESETTISTITLQATEPDGGTITFNITNGALPTGLSLTGANIDGTTTAESSTTLYSFTIEAIDDENQATPRNFSITVNSAAIIPSENFTINTYTGNGSTQSIEGKIGTAAEFNGTSSKITLPTSIKPTDSIMSISLWASNNSTARKSIFYLEYNNAPSFLALENNLYTDSTALGVYYNNTIVITAANENLPTDGSWHHIVVTASATEVKLYKNGSQIGSTASVTVNTNALTAAHIGVRDYNNDLYWDGKIDQVRMFNRVLSTDNNGVNEITTLYSENNASSTKSTTDIFGDGSGVALYELDEDANDTGVPIDSGQSAVFNGSSSKIDLGNNSSNNSSVISVSLWFKTSGHSGTGTIINNGGANSGETGYYLGLTSSGYLRFNATGIGNIDGSVNYADGSWHNVIMTLNNGAYNVYVDGNTTPVINGTGIFTSTATRPTWIGQFSYTSANIEFFNGSIDQVRIYDTALSSGDVTNLYNESSVPTTNLVAHYKLDGNANDETTNYNGTATSITYSDPAVRNYSGTPTNINFLGMAFQPDLVWIKARSGTYGSNPHRLEDSVRGSFYLSTSSTAQQQSVTSGIQSYNTNGFTVGSGNSYNGSSTDYVAWCWKAAGAANTYNVLEGGTVTSDSTASGAGITAGTITTGWEVSANRDAGFSIVKYTGDGSGNNTSTTVGHGLSSAPELVIAKILDTSGNWQIQYAKDSDNLAGSFSTAAFINHSAVVPTSTVFNPYYANSSNNFITYCFHSVDGYQKVGSYEGDGTSSGTTINVGFRPRFLLVKNADTGATNWFLFDSVRDPSNPIDSYLVPNSSAIEADFDSVNFNDDGFELLSNLAYLNQLNDTYIYLAIA